MKSDSKEQGDKAGYLLAKLFLNSLYGKFGSNPENYGKFMFIEPQHIAAAEQDGYEFAGEVNRWALVERDLGEEEMRFYDVSVAASITGWVRAYMWRSIRKCNGVIYCDTDSIAADDVEKLEFDATKLGAWDIEADCDFGAVSGKKLYAFHDKNTDKWKTASKGARLDYKQLIELAQGKCVEYANDAPTFSIKKNPTFLKRTLARNAKIQ